MKPSIKARLRDIAIAAAFGIGVSAVLFFVFEMGAGFGELKCRFEMWQEAKA